MLGQSGTEDYGENNNIIGMDFCSGVERQTKKRRFETTPENVTSSLMSGMTITSHTLSHTKNASILT